MRVNVHGVQYVHIPRQRQFCGIMLRITATPHVGYVRCMTLDGFQDGPGDGLGALHTAARNGDWSMVSPASGAAFPGNLDRLECLRLHLSFGLTSFSGGRVLLVS